MEDYFLKFRNGIIGINATIPTPNNASQAIIYADWTASGRNYLPIEQRINTEIMPYVANTHTETNATGMAMTHAYHTAQQIIKQHVNAAKDDLIISAGSGMTRLVNKLQRMLGLRKDNIPTNRPVVFITHMEHHSNQTSWLETIAQVEIINPTPDGLVDLKHFKNLVEQYKDRELKIASVTACSNVTGIITPYHEIAKIIHQANGYCFVDFACSAPYVNINMHPANDGEHLDAVMFSPHKFLGGPGSTGVLVFNRKIYKNAIPDNPGGGTVDWTNPWGEHKYIDDIEVREDGGTPAFLQTIKTAMCMQLKNEMGINNIIKREHDLLEILWSKISNIPNLHILAAQHKKRLAIVSFYIDDLHYNLVVRLLNDRYGIQTRGGCSCAGTYGHYLLNVDKEKSKQISDKISLGDYSTKPGWIRVSLHPTMTNKEVEIIGDAICEISKNHKQWAKDYNLNHACGGATTSNDYTDSSIKVKMEKALTTSFTT